MKITFLQLILAGSVSLLAIFLMRTILIYAVLISTLLLCSWLLGLLICLQHGQVPVSVDDSASVCDNKRFVLHHTVVRL